MRSSRDGREVAGFLFFEELAVESLGVVNLVRLEDSPEGFGVKLKIEAIAFEP